METQQQSPFSNEQYTVGWICALPIEMAAAKGMLDEEYGAPQTPAAEADQNAYLLGRIGNFKIVIACLPKDQVGSVSAAVAARDMVSTFPKIRIGLMVGIGAGMPDEENDVRLGDVVISSDKASGGVVVYDFGKRLADGSFQSISILNRPPRSLSSALAQLQAAHIMRENYISGYINDMLKNYPFMRKTGYRRPAQDTDRLFNVNYPHSAGRTCSGCDPSEEVDRESRYDEEPVIHYGTIATGDSVIKHAPTREELKQKHGAICLEMEASGLMNNFPCIVVRGISDYADSHKNDRWHAYAAAAAAGCAKELLQYVQPKEIDMATSAKDVLDQVQEDIFSIKSAFNSDQTKRILDWISPLDSSMQQSLMFKRRQQGTGLWFLHSEEFQRWIDRPTEVLFCPGIPGAGKTILCSIVIDFLIKKYSDDPDIQVAYVFCSYQSRGTQSTHGILLNLLKQLAYRNSGELPSHIVELYDSKKSKNSTDLSQDELQKALSQTAGLYKRVFIVIDGLDEYLPSEPQERRLLLSQIFQLQKKFPVSIMATARFISEILNDFDGFPFKEIRADTEDVLSYANSRIPDLVRGTISQYPETQQQIQESIVQRADGMFLLATLHLDHLMGFPTVGELEEALPLLSHGEDGLAGAYNLAITRIQSQSGAYQRLAFKILSWLTYSRRELLEEELRHALAIRDNMESLDPKYLPASEIIDSFCAGLVIREDDTGFVRLVHYSTKEYLLHHILLRYSETQITKNCLVYLSMRDFSVGQCSAENEYERRLEYYPFYGYCARYWGSHAKVALSESPEVKALILTFFNKTSQLSAMCQVLMQMRGDREPAMRDFMPLDHFQNTWSSLPSDVTGVHLAALFGLNGIISHYLELNEDMEPLDTNIRTPLVYAIQAGQEETVTLLLKTKYASLNKSDIDGQSPLMVAMSQKDVSLAKMLIQNGADVRAEGLGECALDKAAAAGDVDMIQLLLDKGADINHQIWYYWRPDISTPLLLALGNGHRDASELLLDRGADVKLLDEGSDRLLSKIWSSANEETIRAIIGRGAHVNPTIGNKTPLQRVLTTGEMPSYHGPTYLDSNSEGSCERIVKLLLEAGADPNKNFHEWIFSENYRSKVHITRHTDFSIQPKDLTRQLEHRSPLMLALENGYDAIVYLLLDHGADPKLGTEHLEMPLFHAAMYGRPHLIQLFLDNGCDINDQNTHMETAIFWAASNGNMETVAHLIRQGADLFSRNQYLETILMFAAKSGNPQMVKMFLDQGLDTESEDIAGNTALFHAAGEDNEDVIKLLLISGSNIHHRNALAETPIFWAARKGNTAVIQLLLAKGAELDARNIFTETPLIYAASNLAQKREWIGLELIGCETYATSTTPASTKIVHFNDLAGTIELCLQRGAEANPIGDSGKLQLSLYELLISYGDYGNRRDYLPGEWWEYGVSRRNSVFSLLRMCWKDRLQSFNNEQLELFLHHICFARPAGLHFTFCKEFTLSKQRQDWQMCKATPFLWAVKARDIPLVEKFLDIQGNLDVTDPFYQAALLVATEAGDADMVRLLLNPGSYSTPASFCPSKAFLCAAKEENSAIIQLLLSRTSIDLETRSSALILSAWAGETYAVELLLDDLTGTRARDVVGRTPCHYAAASGSRDVVLVLLEHNVQSLDIKDDYGRTPLFWAVYNCHFPVAEALLDAGADPNNVDYGGYSLLCLTDRTDYDETYYNLNYDKGSVFSRWSDSRLLSRKPDYDADLKLKDDRIELNGYSPLFFAAGNGQDSMIKLLLHHGADPNISNRDGETALCWAAGGGHAIATRLLLDAGAIPGPPSNSVQNPLHWAVEATRRTSLAFRSVDLPPVIGADVEGVAKVLLEHGANPNFEAHDIQPILCSAAFRKSNGIMRLLLKAGSNPNAKDSQGRTPLHWAAATGSDDLVSLLLAHGALPTLGNNFDWTPMMVAIRRAHLKCMLALLGTDSIGQLLTDRSCRSALSKRQSRRILLVEKYLLHESLGPEILEVFEAQMRPFSDVFSEKGNRIRPSSSASHSTQEKDIKLGHPILKVNDTSTSSSSPSFECDSTDSAPSEHRHTLEFTTHNRADRISYVEERTPNYIFRPSNTHSTRPKKSESISSERSAVIDDRNWRAPETVSNSSATGLENEDFAYFRPNRLESAPPESSFDNGLRNHDMWTYTPAFEREESGAVYHSDCQFKVIVSRSSTDAQESCVVCNCSPVVPHHELYCYICTRRRLRLCRECAFDYPNFSLQNTGNCPFKRFHGEFEGEKN